MHTGKTEHVWVDPMGRIETDVRRPGDVPQARHAGAWLSEDGRHKVDTTKRVLKAKAALARFSRAWRIGSRGSRR